MDIIVTDLFGYNISDNSPLILITTNSIHKFLNKLTSNNDSIIFEYDINKINKSLSDHNINSKNYIPLGHILYEQSSTKLPSSLVLANRNFCRTPTDYEIITQFETGNIIRPFTLIDNVKYYSVGLFFNINNNLDNNNIAVFDPKYIINLQNTNNEKVTANDLFLLSSGLCGIKTINRSMFDNKNTKNIKLLSSTGKYLTGSPDKNVKIKSKQNDNKQNFSYNAQGELVSENKCLTVKNNNVLMDDCQNSNDQKWSMVNDKITLLNDSSKCLTSNPNNDSVVISTCDDNSSIQSWDKEDTTSNPEFKWDKFKGKNVVLVSSDNPWYVNNDDDESLIINYPVERILLKDGVYDSTYRDNANYKTNVILNPNLPDLGLGYSIKSREQYIEGFETDNKSNNNYIQLCIVVILILAFIIVYKKNYTLVNN